MFEIKVAPQAAADLLEIKDYIENELQNPIAAHNTISKIIETYENLTAFPNVGIPVEKYVEIKYENQIVRIEYSNKKVEDEFKKILQKVLTNQHYEK